MPVLFQPVPPRGRLWGGFITWLVSVTWWRWAFSRGLIEGADYDACRSFQQILTWKQWENNPTAHSSFFPYWLLHSPTLVRTDAHTQNIMHLQFTDIFTNIHTLTLCAHKDAQKPIIPIDGVSSASQGTSQLHLPLVLWCVCAGGWLVIHVYLLKGGGRGHFPCHTTLILPLNHLAVSPTSPLNRVPSAPVPGNQEGKWWNTNNVCCERKSKRGLSGLWRQWRETRGSENEKRGWRMCGGGEEVLMTGVSVNSSSSIDC